MDYRLTTDACKQITCESYLCIILTCFSYIIVTHSPVKIICNHHRNKYLHQFAEQYMKLIELYENEDQYKITEMDLSEDEIADILDMKCSKMINAFKLANRCLYRGVKDLQESSPQFASSIIRPNRNPVEMEPDKHSLICGAMEDLGLPSRRNSLFCSADRNTSSVWGVPYILFVEDGWQGLTFDRVPTNEYSFMVLYGLARSILNSDKTHDEKDKEMKTDIKDLKPNLIKNPSGLASILRKEHKDILITGKKYYLLKSRTMETAEVLSHFHLREY